MTHILLLEDNPNDSELLLNALRQRSAWTIRTAANCREASRLLEEWTPDLILCDIHLPDCNGLAWIAEIRRGGYRGSILAITGAANSTENVIAALKAGADDYLLKNEETYRQLPGLIEQALTQRRSLMARRQPLRVLYACNNPLTAETCRRDLHQKAPHIHLTFVHTLAALQQALQRHTEFDAVVLDGDLPEANLPTIFRQLSPAQYPNLVWLAADPNPSPELARVLLVNGLAAYLPRSGEAYCTLLPIMLENAVTAQYLQQAQTNWALSEARYSRLVENLPDVVYRFDFTPQPHLTYISPAIRQLTGRSPESLLVSAEALYQAIHPEDRAAFRTQLEQGAPSAVIRWLTVEGRPVWTELRNTVLADENGRILAVEGIARDISETRRVRTHLQRRVKEQELSIELGRIVIESQSTDGLCQRTAEAVTAAFYADLFAIFLLEEDGKSLRVHPSSRGIAPQEAGRSIPLRRGGLGRCLRRRETVQVEAEDPSCSEPPFSGPPAARLCAPILSGEQVWGAICIGKRPPHPLSESDRRLATLIAEHLALGLEKLHLLQKEQRRRAEADALRHAISHLSRAPLEVDKVLTHILEALQTVVPYTSASLALLEGDFLRFVANKNLPDSTHNLRVPIADNALMAEIVANPQPVILHDAQKTPEFRQFATNLPPIRAWLCQPLMNEGKLVGYLFCDHTESGVFTEEHTRLSAPFAQQAALAIEKARLYEQTLHAARRLETLHRVSQDILALQDDPQALYRAIHQAAARLMPCDAFTIALLEGEERINAVYLAEGDTVSPPRSIERKGRFPCHVLEHRRSLLIADLEKHPTAPHLQECEQHPNKPRAVVATPIRLGEQILGVMAAQAHRPNAYQQEDLRLLETLATYVAIALENRRLFADLQNRLHEAHIIRRVHETLLAHRDPGSLRTRILQILIEHIPPAEKGSILLLEEDGSLRVDTSLGYTLAVPGVSFPPGKGYAQQCIREGRGITIANAQDSPWFYRTTETPQEVNQIQSALVVPLISQGKIIGALSLDNTQDSQAFGPAELQLMETLAPSIALAIDNSLLFAALDSRVKELAAINHLLEEVQQTLPPDKLVARFFATAAALVPLEGGLHLQQTPSGAWQVTQRLGQDETLPLPALPQRLEESISQIALAEPHANGLLLNLKGTPQQALLLISTAPLSAEQMRLLHTLHDLLLNALQQIHLHWRTREQVALLSSMRDINTTLLGSLDFKMVFNLVLAHISTYLKPDQVQIWQANDTLQELNLVAWQGLGRPARPRLRYGEGFAGALVLQRKSRSHGLAPSEQHNLPDLEGLPAALHWHFGLPLVAKGKIKGVLALHYAQPYAITFEQEDYLRTLAGQAALAIDNTETWHKAQRNNLELFQAYESTLKAWSILLEMRQLEPPGHIERVLPLGLKLARRAGLHGDALLHFKWGVWLHNVGKLALPDELVHKPPPLTPEEEAEIARHPEYARRILRGLSFVKNAINIPYAHHERWDGTGYPRGLKGPFIPLEARIFAIVDAWDVLQSPLPQHPAKSRAEAIAYLEAERGKQFDPELVALFLDMVRNGEV